MKNVSRQKRLIIERANKRMLGEAEMSCPEATKDSELNEKNKKKIAIVLNTAWNIFNFAKYVWFSNI